MSLELEQYLLEIGVIPATPLMEIGKVVDTKQEYTKLPAYDEETQEYMF